MFCCPRPLALMTPHRSSACRLLFRLGPFCFRPTPATLVSLLSSVSLYRLLPRPSLPSFPVFVVSSRSLPDSLRRLCFPRVLSTFFHARAWLIKRRGLFSNRVFVFPRCPINIKTTGHKHARTRSTCARAVAGGTNGGGRKRKFYTPRKRGKPLKWTQSSKHYNNSHRLSCCITALQRYASVSVCM